MAFQDVDLSKTAFTLCPLNNDAASCLHIAHNQPYLRHVKSDIGSDNRSHVRSRTQRDGTPYMTSTVTKLAVETDLVPKHSILGWTFGSDPERCDYLLADSKKGGVSGLHFAIKFNWEYGATLVVSHSRDNPTIIRNEVDTISLLHGDQWSLVTPSSTIEAGGTVFILDIPTVTDRGNLQMSYDQSLKILQQMIKDTPPNIQTMAIKQRGKETPAVKATDKTNVAGMYHRMERIGSGVFGYVFRATEKRTGKIVALKEFKLNSTTNVRKIEREIELLRSLRHVHITKYLDAIETPGCYVLIMELVGGKTLADLNDISHRQTLDLAQQTIKAVNYLHDQYVTHRDIKPANILIVRDDPIFCKLSDFSESSSSPALLQTDCGTKAYSAPEITDPPYTKAVDIWSLGAVITQYWYKHPSLSLYDLTETSHDSWLPDTQGPGVDGYVTLQRKKTHTLQWTSSRSDKLGKWRSSLYSIPEQHRGEKMAELLLGMLATEPSKRLSASECRYRLENVKLANPPRGSPRSLKRSSSAPLGNVRAAKNPRRARKDAHTAFPAPAIEDAGDVVNQSNFNTNIPGDFVAAVHEITRDDLPNEPEMNTIWSNDILGPITETPEGEFFIEPTLINDPFNRSLGPIHETPEDDLANEPKLNFNNELTLNNEATLSNDLLNRSLAPTHQPAEEDLANEPQLTLNIEPILSSLNDAEEGSVRETNFNSNSMVNVADIFRSMGRAVPSNEVLRRDYSLKTVPCSQFVSILGSARIPKELGSSGLGDLQALDVSVDHGHGSHEESDEEEESDDEEKSDDEGRSDNGEESDDDERNHSNTRGDVNN